MINEFPGHFMSPIRVNGSAIESVFSSLKYITGGHLSPANYGSSVGMLVTQRNPNSEKEYRTDKLN